jgi:hypothetical protein
MCINPTYKLGDEALADEEYDPFKPNDYEQMLVRKRRIEKQLTTLIQLKARPEPAASIDLNASAEDVFNQRVQNSKVHKMMSNMGW